MEDWTYEDFKTNFEDAMIEYDDCVTFGKPEEERKEALRILVVAMQDMFDHVAKGNEDDQQSFEREATNIDNMMAALAALEQRWAALAALEQRCRQEE